MQGFQSGEGHGKAAKAEVSVKTIALGTCAINAAYK